MKSSSLSMARQVSNRGVALVIVLAILVLFAGLVVSFMATATGERGAAEAAAASGNARQFADSTVNLVIGQIQDATSLRDDATGKPKEGVTWASQPGAIRTYSGKLSSAKTTVTGKPKGTYYYDYTAGASDYVFKLYSSDKMKVTSSDYGAKELPGEVKVIETWNRENPDPAYADLNEPFLSPRPDIDPSGLVVEPRYPIIDPRAKYDSNGGAITSAASGIVDGFDAKFTTSKQLKLVDPTGTAATQSPVPYLPMPVKWIYVLRDGTIGNTNLATDATDSNPIVGRIAFWVDDETCKLNINTASEGTFWDTPSVSSSQEAGRIDSNSGSITYDPAKGLNLATSQPGRGEFQRYPGHPLTTCLSPALGWLWNVTPTTPVYPGAQGGTYQQFKEAIYQISPFTPFGKPTTQGGTWNSDPEATGNYSYYKDIGAVGANKWEPQAVVKTKHLYATVDELIFQTQRNSGGATPKGLANGKLTPRALEKLRFFLTANSRAPELNLFGRPRVTLWPIHANFDLRTHFDDLFAFTSTIAKDPAGVESKDKRFYLTRQDATSDIKDFDVQTSKMHQYLQWLTGGDSSGASAGEVPGFGGSFQAKYPSPGAGASDRDQILAEILDYSRAVNLIDTGTPSRAANKFIPYTPRFYPPGYSETNSAGGYVPRDRRSYDWSGQVVPLKIGGQRATTPVTNITNGHVINGAAGMGRFVVVSEAALIFHRTTDPDPITGAARKPLVNGSAQAMQGVLVLEMSTTMPGFPGIRPTYYTVAKATRPTFVEVRTGSAVTTPPTDIQFSTLPEINICNVSPHEVTDGRGFMPMQGAQASMHWFPEHFGPTYLNPLLPAMFNAGGVPDPDLDSKRNRAFAPCKAKAFAKGNSTYLRDTSGSNTNATIRRYPYVSNTFAIPTPTANNGTPPNFDLYLQGGAFDVEIWSGEAPDDPRRVLVQVLHLDFGDAPSTPPATQTSAFRIGVIAHETGDRKFEARFPATTNKGANRDDWIKSSDVVRSIEYTGGYNDGKAGDLRLLAARTEVPANHYAMRDGPTAYKAATQQIHGLTSSHGEAVPSGYSDGGKTAVLAKGGRNRGSKPAILPKFVGAGGVLRSDNGPGDWDRGLSKHMDGAFGNKVDEGNLRFEYGVATVDARSPYFRGRSIEDTGQSFFTPNRQLPSVAMIGSLPTGVRANKPWQTLLFRPDRETGPGHPGAKSGQPPDHLWLDLFHLPIVEPYAISEPFATAGKVNLNYVIAPFGYAKGGEGSNPNTANRRSYIRRDTALRGALKSTFMMAVPTGQAEGAHAEGPLGVTIQFRWPLDLDRTLETLETRLNKPGGVLFRSASEICDIDLFPNGLSVSDWQTFWDTSYAQTGDNMRERPYAHIYPRLTTKSNVYTVYMRCQTIRKAPGGTASVFDPLKDQVTSEYRGSATIERYVDPNDENLAPGGKVNPAGYDERADRVDPYYRYRVIATKQFSPR